MKIKSGPVIHDIRMLKLLILWENTGKIKEFSVNAGSSNYDNSTKAFFILHKI